MSIKAVIFDYGGVICYTPSRETEEALEKITGLPLDALRELHRKYRCEYDRGAYDTKEYYRFILSAAGVSLDDETLGKAAETEMNGWKRLNVDTLTLMRDIKAAGFIMGILSNMPRDFLAWVRDNVPVFYEADPALFSCEYGLIKPEAAIYEKLKERCGCEFREIVFFDDIPDNITKARELGIEGFVWEGPGAARKKLRELGGEFAALCYGPVCILCM
jgi:putative hydrolase of the HAD superfamily